MGRIVQLILLYFFYQVVAVVPFLLAFGWSSEGDVQWADFFTDMSNATKVHILIVSEVAFLLHLLLGKYVATEDLKWHRHLSVPCLLAGGAALCVLPITDLLVSWLQLPDTNAAFLSEMGHTFWGVFSIVVLAPIFEEVLFRGALLGYLWRQTGDAKMAIALSAILFGLVHMNMAQTIPAILIGCLMGWIYVRSGCLWLTIFYHAVNNGVAVLSIHFLPSNADSLTTWLGMPVTLALAAVSVALLAVCLTVMHKHLSQPVKQ